jgi:hypothetical protein
LVVAQVLKKLLAVGLLIQVEVAQHQTVGFGLAVFDGLFSRGGLVHLVDLQLLQLTPQGGALSLHVINDEGLQIWVNRAEIHKCLLLKWL